jgi:hypothetical protein
MVRVGQGTETQVVRHSKRYRGVRHWFIFPKALLCLRVGTLKESFFAATWQKKPTRTCELLLKKLKEKKHMPGYGNNLKLLGGNTLTK